VDNKRAVEVIMLWFPLTHRFILTYYRTWVKVKQAAPFD